MVVETPALQAQKEMEDVAPPKETTDPKS